MAEPPGRVVSVAEFLGDKPGWTTPEMLGFQAEEMNEAIEVMLQQQRSGSQMMRLMHLRQLLGQQVTRTVHPQQVPRQQVLGTAHPQQVPRQQVMGTVHPQHLPQQVMAKIHPRHLPGQPVTRAVHPQRLPRQTLTAAIYPQHLPQQSVTRAVRPQQLPGQQVIGTVHPQLLPRQNRLPSSPVNNEVAPSAAPSARKRRRSNTGYEETQYAPSEKRQKEQHVSNPLSTGNKRRRDLFENGEDLSLNIEKRQKLSFDTGPGSTATYAQPEDTNIGRVIAGGNSQNNDPRTSTSDASVSTELSPTPATGDRDLDVKFVKNPTRFTPDLGLQVQIGGTWLSAIEHPVYVNLLPPQAIDTNQYEHKRASGRGNLDFTAYLASQHSWGERREHRPDILFAYKHNGQWHASQPRLIIYNDHGTERLVVDVINHRPLKAFPNLPITISKNVEGWLMEAWQRQDKNIQLEDFIQRMPFTADDDVWKGKGKKFSNALTQRKDRFRNRGRCLSWKMKEHNRLHDQQLARDMSVNPTWLAANTTRYLEDLTVEEGKRLEAATLISGRHMKKAGGRKLEGDAKAAKEAKMKELLDEPNKNGKTPVISVANLKESTRAAKTPAKKNRQSKRQETARQSVVTDGAPYGMQPYHDFPHQQVEAGPLTLSRSADLSADGYAHLSDNKYLPSLDFADGEYSQGSIDTNEVYAQTNEIPLPPRHVTGTRQTLLDGSPDRPGLVNSQHVSGRQNGSSLRSDADASPLTFVNSDGKEYSDSSWNQSSSASAAPFLMDPALQGYFNSSSLAYQPSAEDSLNLQIYPKSSSEISASASPPLAVFGSAQQEHSGSTLEQSTLADQSYPELDSHGEAFLDSLWEKTSFGNPSTAAVVPNMQGDSNPSSEQSTSAYQEHVGVMPDKQGSSSSSSKQSVSVYQLSVGVDSGLQGYSNPPPEQSTPTYSPLAGAMPNIQGNSSSTSKESASGNSSPVVLDPSLQGHSDLSWSPSTAYPPPSTSVTPTITALQHPSLDAIYYSDAARQPAGIGRPLAQAERAPKGRAAQNGRLVQAQKVAPQRNQQQRISDTVSLQQQTPYIQQVDNSYLTAGDDGHYPSQYQLYGSATHPTGQPSHLPLHEASTNGDELTKHSDPYVDPGTMDAFTQQLRETDIYLQQKYGLQPTRSPPSEGHVPSLSPSANTGTESGAGPDTTPITEIDETLPSFDSDYDKRFFEIMNAHGYSAQSANASQP